jgi:hypothetical protein
MFRLHNVCPSKWRLMRIRRQMCDHMFEVHKLWCCHNRPTALNPIRFSWLSHVEIYKNKQNLWPDSESKLYRPAKLVPPFEGRECHLVSAKDPFGCILRLLDRNNYFSSKQLFSSTHEAECTPFHNHYFSENLVAPGIKPGHLDL